MTWTAPRTWVAAETVTAALLNTHLRDNQLASEAAVVTTAEDLIRGTGATAIARQAAITAGQWLAVVAGPLIGGAAPNIPSGLIVFFNGTSCPAGWTEVIELRGRTVLGMPSGGTVGGTSGTPLTDLGTRVITGVPAHTHSEGSLAAASGGAHTHHYLGGSGGGPSDYAPAAGIIGPSSSDGAHTHTASGSLASTGSASVDVTMPYIQYLACQAN